MASIFGILTLAFMGATPVQMETSEQQKPSQEAFPPHLLEVEPDPGEVQGLDLQVCATFDATDDGLGPDWQGPVWFEIAGFEKETSLRLFAADRPDDPTSRRGCSTPLRQLLQNGELDAMPPTGPLEVAVRYVNREGDEHRHAWQVQLSLEAPEPPEEVHRIREVDRRLQTMDEDVLETMAGHYLDGEVLYVYLQDETDPETVQAEVKAALGGALPSGGIRVVRPAPPLQDRQFDEWSNEATRVIAGVPEIRLFMSTGCCGAPDRLIYGVETVYSAHLLRRVLEQTSVPQEAVSVWIAHMPSLEEQAVAANGVAITVEFTPIVHRGEALRAEVVWTNRGDRTVEFTYGAAVPFDLTVFTPAGDAVWTLYSSGFIMDLGATARLARGEKKRFIKYWDLTDEDSFALPPGDYLVQAKSEIHPDSPVRLRETSLVSEPYPLRIDP